MAKWSEIEVSEHVRSHPSCDPYLAWWSTKEGKDHCLGIREFRRLKKEGREKQARLPVLIRLREGKTANDLLARDWPDPPWIPELYTRPTHSLAGARYCTAIVTEAVAIDLESGANGLDQIVERVKAGQSLSQDNFRPPPISNQGPHVEHQETELPKPGAKTVITGIIDDGLPIANRRFRWFDSRARAEKTRIAFFWAQDRPEGETRLPYGGEFTASQINGALSKPGFDEDLFYRKAGLLDLTIENRRQLARRVTHGAHVMDLVAGMDPDRVKRRRWRWPRPIICVQLASTATADTSGAILDAFVLDAIRYIVDRADRIKSAKPLPIVINFSYGRVAGPHDGTSDLELAIDEIIDCTGGRVQIVVPAGNSFLARCHAVVGKGDLNAEGPINLRWRVLPDDRTNSFMEIWLPQRSPTEKDSPPVSLTIVTPDGVASQPLSGPSGSEMALKEGEDGDAIRSAGLGSQTLGGDGGDAIATARYLFKPFPETGGESPAGRGMFLVTVQPTADPLEGHPVPLIPSGDWQVILKDNGLREGEEVHAWIQRDDTPMGYRRRGRQSFFADPNYRRFDGRGDINLEDPKRAGDPRSYVKRQGTMSALATGRLTTVVGGFYGDDFRPSHISSSGPGLDGVGGNSRQGPDLAAITDDSRIRLGVLASGTRSGTRVAINGTSVAAPQVARRRVRATEKSVAKKPVKSLPQPDIAGIPVEEILGLGGKALNPDKREGRGRVWRRSKSQRWNPNGVWAKTAPNTTDDDEA